MQITVTIPDELAAQAQAQGVSPERYIEQWAADQIVEPRPQPHSPAEAVAKIRELRKGNRLDGLTFKDLIHEGHSY